MVKQRRRPRLPKIESLAFLEPTDRLERRDGKLYVVDSKGIYGAIRVEDEETKGWPKFQENVAQMTKAGEINNAILAVGRYRWITQPAKDARVELLRTRWRELFGDAMFVTDDDIPAFLKSKS